MPITLAKIASKTATVAIPVDGDTLNVTYFPNKVTTQAIAHIEAGGDQFDQALAGLISTWDLYEDDTQTALFPLDRLAELGLPLCVQISQAIAQDIRPKQMTA